MSEITFEEALSRARNAVEQLASQQNLGPLMILEDHIIETAYAWFFPYDSVAFVMNDSISDALAGNLPVKVPRDGSSVTFHEPD